MTSNPAQGIPLIEDLKIGDVLIWNGTVGPHCGGRFPAPGTVVTVDQIDAFIIVVRANGRCQGFDAVEVPQCFVYPAAIVPVPPIRTEMVTIEGLKRGDVLRYVGPDFSTGWGTGTEVHVKAVSGRMIAVEAGGLTRGFYDDEIPTLFERIAVQMGITFSYDLSRCEKCNAPNAYGAPANYPKDKPVMFRCGMCRAHYGA